MPQKPPARPSAWPRRLMLLGACSIIILLIVVATALSRGNFALAFPGMLGVMALLMVVALCMAWMNRQQD